MNLPAGLLARCRFPPPAEGPVALAVSGGPDSTALLLLAAAAGLSGQAIHVDHGLRPGSAAEASLVERAARSAGFGFVGLRAAVAPGPNLEARARSARYRALPRGTLTGHTMDDQAETVVLNLLRGAGVDGLAAMRSTAAVGRPLLALRRSETAAVCAAAGVEVVADPSNIDPRFRRNRVRAEVLPLLCDVAGRDVVPILARAASLLEGDAELLDSLAAEVEASDTAELARCPLPLRRRAVRRWITRSRGGLYPPSAAEVERVLAVAAGAVRACEVEGGWRVWRRGGRLGVSRG